MACGGNASVGHVVGVFWPVAKMPSSAMRFSKVRLRAVDLSLDDGDNERPVGNGAVETNGHL